MVGKQNDGKGAILNRALRQRVGGRVNAFVDALDAVAVSPNPKAIDALRLATDDLMRAVARIMLELGRTCEFR